jgi:tetratricopeptide (TPR) repeat protein
MQKLSILVVLFGLALPITLSAQSSDSSSFYLEKARQLSAAQKFWEADKAFETAVQFDTSAIETRVQYANYLIGQRKYYQAVTQFIKVLQQDGNHPVALQKMLDLNFAQGRWNDVISYGNRLVQLNTGAGVQYMLGKASYALENFGPAKKYLSQAIKDDPKNAEAVALLANVLVELGDVKQATTVYLNAIELSPDNNQLIYQIGLLYFSTNNKKEAIRYFEMAATKGYKQDLSYLENLGMAYLNFDVDKGVETLNKVLERKPGNPEILFQIGQAYFKAQKFAEAANTYFKIYENDTSHSKALYMAGVAFQKNGDKGKGIACCEKAIAMDPTLAHLKTEEKPEQ